MKRVKFRSNSKSTRFHWATKSDFIVSDKGALSPNNVAILLRIRADANSSSCERVLESKILQ